MQSFYLGADVSKGYADYGMLKNRTPFDPQIDKINRQRAVRRAAEQKRVVPIVKEQCFC